MDCIEKICELANMKFFIDADRIINVFAKPSEPTHYLVNQVEIESIQIKEDIEGTVNKVTVQTNSVPVLTSTYQDVPSQTLY